MLLCKKKSKAGFLQHLIIGPCKQNVIYSVGFCIKLYIMQKRTCSSSSEPFHLVRSISTRVKTIHSYSKLIIYFIFAKWMFGNLWLKTYKNLPVILIHTFLKIKFNEAIPKVEIKFLSARSPWNAPLFHYLCVVFLYS